MNTKTKKNDFLNQVTQIEHDGTLKALEETVARLLNVEKENLAETSPDYTNTEQPEILTLANTKTLIEHVLQSQTEGAQEN